MISYQFPVVMFHGDDPEDSETALHDARIHPHNLSHEPYEATVTAGGSSYHILFGHQCNGMFLCIPNWKVGCELATLSDVFWNLNSLVHNEEKLCYEDATAIAYALKVLADYIE